VRTYVTYRGFASQGDRLKGFTWVVRLPDAAGGSGPSVHLAFEICDEQDTILIRGSLQLAQAMDRVAAARL